VHGVLLGDDGQKLSKRLRNYPDPVEVFEGLGADAMRFSMLASAAVRGGDMVADRRSIEEAVRQVLLPIWNSWYFLTLYANAASDDAPDGGQTVLDRYALAKARELVQTVTERMDAFDLSGSCAAVLAYLDSLNNWYIRRSRDRFWTGDATAIATLHTALEVLCRTSAPLLPLLTDTIWPALTGRQSVHLADWPAADELPADADLVAAMDTVRDVCSAAASVRKQQKLRVRLPLASLTVSSPDAESLRPYVDLIAEEVNVKEVVLTSETTVDRALKLVPAVLGPRVGPDMQKLLRAAKEGSYEVDGETVTVAGRTMAADEYELVLQGGDEGTRVVPGRDVVVTLDTAVTPALAAEGLARDLVRAINDARRAEGLHVSDRIKLVIDVDGHHDVRDAIEAHRDLVAAEVLATELVVVGATDRDHHHPTDGHRVELADGRVVHLALQRT
jgi:isoleucyl-tRNA synthetase